MSATDRAKPGAAGAETGTEAAAAAEGAGTSVDKPASMVRRIFLNPVSFTFLALVLIMLVFAVMAAGKFNTSANIISLAQNVAILTVVSVGTTFVIITAGVDLSIPSGIVLGEVFALKALALIKVGEGTAVDVLGEDSKGWYMLVALAGSLLAGLLIGVVNGVVVGYLRVPPLLATLGTLGAGLGVALLLQNGVNTATYALNPVASGRIVPGLPNLVLVGLAVAIIGVILLHYSVFGRHTYAIGSNEEAARRVGVKVERHLLRVYILGGLTSGLGGYLSVAYFSTTSLSGHSTDNLQAITAVALGGTSLFGGVGTIVGSVIGVWIPAVLRNGFVIVGVQPYWQMVALGAVLIAAVYSDQIRRRSRSRR